VKVAVMCFGFKKSNLRKQPWRYIYEIAKGLDKHGHKVFVITDENEELPQDLRIVPVKKLFSSLKGESKELTEVLNDKNPDVVVMLMGMTSFLRKAPSIKKPTVGVITSPVYTLGELLRNVGLSDLITYRRYTLIHLISLIIPSHPVKGWGRKLTRFVVLSKRTGKRMISKGIPPDKIVEIPPGIDDEFLMKADEALIQRIKPEINPDGTPIIMYYTSPLTLRGTDIAVKALPYILKETDVKLLILSRPDYPSIKKEEEKLRRIARKLEVERNLIIVSKLLPLNEIKAYLSAADVIVLPFKLIHSDMPLSLLEAMALGKPVVSTNVGCVPELLNERGLVVEPNNPEELANAVIRLLKDNELASELGEKSREFMETYPHWDDASKEFVGLIQEVVKNED